MTYQKPELNVLGSAEVAILGDKPDFANSDGQPDGYTLPAYAVDE
jgi:hypothetical protein